MKQNDRMSEAEELSSARQKMMQNMSSSSEDDSEEVTEADYKARDEAEKLETEMLKTQLGIETEDEKTKKKKAKRKKRAEEYGEVDVAGEIQLFEEIITVNKTLRITSIIFAFLLAFVCVFSISNYLHYYYIADGGFRVTVKRHEHEYTEFGRRVDGHCQSNGYTVYLCNYPYCTSETKVEDLDKGPHKYGVPEILSEIKIDEETGEETVVKFQEFTCTVCGQKNRAPYYGD